MTASGTRPRTWPVWLLAVPAGVAIWGGWVELGAMCGFGPVRPLPGIADSLVINLAVTLPIGVEALGALAVARVVDPTTPAPVQVFARWCAGIALALGGAGQVGYHLLAASGATVAPWPVVAVVAVLPVVTLALGATLAHLMHAHTPVEETPTDETELERNTEEHVSSSLPQQYPVANQSPPPGWHRTSGFDARSAVPPTGAAVNRPGYGLPLPEPSPFPVDPDPREATPVIPEPKPAPVKRPAARATASGGPPCPVTRLKRQNPTWTHKQLATAAGVSERTVRRRLAAAKPAADQPQPGEVAA